MKKIKLNNGVEMPLQGFGVFQITDMAECERVVLQALEVGYRLIDTASSYKNEEFVGKAVKNSGILREELFITSKAYIQETGYERTKKAFENTLKKLGTDYLDLYLIHMPFGDYYGSWRAMEELYAAGRIRAVGVSNFYASRLVDLCYNVDVLPAVNQIECHPLYQRADEIEIMRGYDICPQAWAPFAEGLKNIFSNPVLLKIAENHGKTAAQVILRWNLQRGVAVIPKSVRRDRMEENADIWDFELKKEEMEQIGLLDTGCPAMLDPLLPREVRRVYDYLNNPVLTSLE